MNQTQTTINISVNIPRQTMEDIFVTALEGGSNYWYYLSNETVKNIRDVVPKSEEAPLSTALFKAVFDHGIEVPINDAENPSEVLGVISNKTMQSRLQKMVDDGNGDTLQLEINEEGDGDTSDAIFQYLTMGNIVFG
jgi:hypothetical protein